MTGSPSHRIDVEDEDPIDDEEGEEDSSVVIDEATSLIERRKRISFCMLESSAESAPGIRSCTATVTPLTLQSDHHSVIKTTTKTETVDNIVDDGIDAMLSPGTPCSQCLKEQACRRARSSQYNPSNNGGRNDSVSGHNGGQEFFGSSEECCSTGSGSCNSSCGGSCAGGQQTPLALQVIDVPTSINNSQQQQRRHLSKMSPCSIGMASTPDISAPSGPRVATISCPQFESIRLYNKNSRSVPEDLPGGLGGSQRHLVTFVTPSMETIPLEMCQDIPDVLI